MDKLTDLERIKLSKTSLERTMNELQDRASSLLLLNLHWKEVEKVLDSAQSSVEERFKELKLREEEFVLKEKDFERRCGEIESEKKDLEQRCRVVELKEKYLDECLRDYELKAEQFGLKEKSFQNRLFEFEVEEKAFKECCRDLDTKRDLASALHPQVKTEEAGILPVKYSSVEHSSRAHLRFCVNMDGKDLQMFLHEHRNENDSIGTEVAMILQLSMDPAKLVLDAMDGFYPPHLSKGDKEFEGNAARRSCILLLEHLNELAPEIKPRVREIAMRLASEWLTKMRVESGHELEVLGFLWLLAAFKLADSYDPDKLLNCLEFVYLHINNNDILKALGFGDTINSMLSRRPHTKPRSAVRFRFHLLSNGLSRKRPREFIAKGDVPLGATTATVSSKIMVSKHLDGSKQDAITGAPSPLSPASASPSSKGAATISTPKRQSVRTNDFVGRTYYRRRRERTNIQP